MFDRQPRRPMRAPETTHRQISATVKWFNTEKGFGFVTPETGEGDAFLHASVLQSAGYDTLSDGATIMCDLARGPKGPQVAVIHSVDTSTASTTSSSSSSSSFAPRGGSRPPRSSGMGGHGGGYDMSPSSGPAGDPQQGTVKWFNTIKGFGFVAPDDGSRDVFVHVSALNRSGLDRLADGQRVIVTVRQGPKGLEADTLEII